MSIQQVIPQKLYKLKISETKHYVFITHSLEHKGRNFWWFSKLYSKAEYKI